MTFRWAVRVGISVLAFVVSAVLVGIVLAVSVPVAECRDLVRQVAEQASLPMCARPLWPQYVALGVGVAVAALVFLRSRRLTKSRDLDSATVPVEG